MFKSLLVLVFAVGLLFAPPVRTVQAIQVPKGFVNKAENATFALYGSSVSEQITDRFICTVTAIMKVKDGYILLGAGHCTAANPDLPADITFDVSSELNGPFMPVQLIKSEMNEPLDYAFYYLPAKEKFQVMEIGDSDKARVNDKVLDINFSLGAAKEESYGRIVSRGMTDTSRTEGVNGDFEVEMFGAGGASGSSVIDMNQHKKIIGIVIYGFPGATMPMIAEPINRIIAHLNGLTFVPLTADQILKQRVADAKAEANASPFARENMDQACYEFLRTANGFVGQPVSAVIADFGQPMSIDYGYAGKNETAYAYAQKFNTPYGPIFSEVEFIVEGEAVNLTATVTSVELDACGTGGNINTLPLGR